MNIDRLCETYGGPEVHTFYVHDYSIVMNIKGVYLRATVCFTQAINVHVSLAE